MIITLEKCPKCEQKNARGVRSLFQNAQVEFKCDACGKTSVMGDTEKNYNSVKEKRQGRERAERNRDRYVRERDEQYQRLRKNALDTLTEIPDAVAHFYDSYSL